MPGPDDSLGARYSVQRDSDPLPDSCALLIALAQNPQIDALLRQSGIGAQQLMQARDALGSTLPLEPADWAHRIATRRGRAPKTSDLDQLLAILRSAESRGYRLLERCGVDLSSLRRRVIEVLSQQNLEQTGPRVTRQSQRTDAAVSSESRWTPRNTRAARQSQIESAASAEATPFPNENPGAPPTPRPNGGPSQSEAPPPLRRSHTLSQQAPVISSDYEERPSPPPQAFAKTPKPPPPPLRLDALNPRSLGPLYGRDEILQALADAVSRERPRPPLLVGAHGSGRTRLAEHLASVLKVPVYRLCAHHFEEESGLRAAFLAIHRQGGVVVLDDLDRIATEQSPDILPALVEAWAQRKVRLVTVCSHETRARLEQWVPGILAGLDTLLLPPLPDDAIIPSVVAAAPLVLKPHGLAQDQVSSIAEQACKLAERYLSNLAQPGRSIDLLDLSAARCARLGMLRLDSDQLRSVVAQRTGLSIDQIQGSADQELLDLEEQLGQRVVGHERAISRICGLVRRNRAGFRSQRPIGSVLLLGPSGIGKTEIAKALARSLFSQEDSLLRLDMSEFSEAHAVARIVGAPPGYVGHDHAGALADPMIEKPHRVVLLDEIEKAHRDVHQLLLQVLDEGRLTDGRGRTLDFRHALVIMTSNLGADLIAQSPRSKRPSPEPSTELRQVVQEVFPIELWNRIEAPLVLHPLDAHELFGILENLTARSSQQLLQERDVSFSLAPSAQKWILELAGQDPELGARPLRHLLRRHIESALADALLSERIGPGMHVLIEWKRKTLHLRPRERDA